MAHFAHIKDGIVDQVIVIEPEVLATGAWGDPSEWVQTSYNTCEGEHKMGGNALRKNFAGVGYTYDKDRDIFIPPKQSETAVFSERKGKYIELIDGKEVSKP